MKKEKENEGDYSSDGIMLAIVLLVHSTYGIQYSLLEHRLTLVAIYSAHPQPVFTNVYALIFNALGRS